MAGVVLEEKRAVVEEHRKCRIKCNDPHRLDRKEMECGHFQKAKKLVDEGNVLCAICPKFIYDGKKQTLLW